MTVLADLDELIHTVRDDLSRRHVVEAVSAYRSGANRAAIISTWVAVVFDIQTKLRALAADGDLQAARIVTEMDKAIKNDDLKKFLILEGAALKQAHDFEFIDDRELIDLKRLRKDRHQCAHPGFHDGALLFAPLPEVARMHIVHAVTHLLAQPPVHGKAALAKVNALLTRVDFPRDVDRVHVLLGDRFLKHGSAAFVTNLVHGLMKCLLREADADLVGHEQAILMTLDASRALRPAETEATIKSKFSKVIRDQDEMVLQRALRFIEWEPRAWGWVRDGDRVLLVEVAKRWDFQINPWSFARTREHLTELRCALDEAFAAASLRAKQEYISTNSRADLADQAIALLDRSATSYRASEAAFAKLVLPMAPYLTPTHISAVLKTVQGNQELYWAGGVPGMMEKFFDAVLDRLPETKNEWRAFLKSRTDDDDVAAGREPDDHYSYPGLRQRMKEEGVWP